ncbi:MAG: hypothetical protein Q9219_007260 [cf. Caloplaca sp. 3 TL-2023]
MPPFRPNPIRFIQCLQAPPRSRLPAAPRTLHNTLPTRSFASEPSNGSPQASKHRRYINIAASVLVAGSVIYYLRHYGRRHLDRIPRRTHLDAPPPSSPSSPSKNPSAPIHIITRDENNNNYNEDLVPTGTSTIPFFPRTIHLPTPTPQQPASTATRTLPYGTDLPPPSSSSSSSSKKEEGEEYHLLGLGIRKVSFLRIQVYVVGLYVAKADLPKLQEGMVRAYFTSSASGDSTTSSATTLVEDEKAELKKVLVEGGMGGRGERIWDEVLRAGGVRSVLRVVPTRSTDFGHMREGWVRSINARSTPGGKANVLGKEEEKQREGLEELVSEFKGIFGGGRKGLGKGKVLMLNRGVGGELGVWAEDDEVPEQQQLVEKKGERGEMKFLGGVADERISRLVWLGYLGGGNVASEDARKSVVDGVMDIVERPIGTVETQVV